MELPIRVMVVLAVTLIIAIVILQFSRNAISDSEQQLAELTDLDDQGERIIDVSVVSSLQVASLAEECVKTHVDKSLASETCFVILGDVQASESAIINRLTIDEEDVSIDLREATNAVQIKYDAASNKVTITG